MVAALVRLLHSGPQDMRLLPKLGPQDVSAYVRVLNRVGRFTTQWSRIDFQQKPNFGTTAYAQLPVKGHLITRLYLVATMPDIYTPQATAIAKSPSGFAGPRFGWTNSLGHALINTANVAIGGTLVDSLDSRLLEMKDEYDTPLEKLVNRNTMIGRIQNGFKETSLGNSTSPTTVYVPLPFWFCKGDLGAALPIDALNVDDVRVGITFRPVSEIYYTDSRAPATNIDGSIPGSALWPILGSKFYTTTGGTSVVPGLALNRTPVSSLVSDISGVRMPLSLSLDDTYLLAEYIYLDKPEANLFRQGTTEIPIVQHYRIEPRDTRGFRDITIPLELSNPTRHLYFMAQNYNALPYNAYFLATKDLSASTDAPIYVNTSGLPTSETYAPWWPDCSGLNAAVAGYLIPGFSSRGSEPITSIELLYEGSFVKTSTDNCALYRSILPSLEERKSPWINRYMYCIPFGQQAGFFPPSVPMGEANMNRIMKKDLRFGIANTGTSPQRVWVYVYAETYTILRIFGGRAALLFAY
jgi:hypothetical protein